MGYRSHVAYTIRFKRQDDYHLFILEAKAKPETVGCFSEIECNPTELCINYEAEDVKWYEAYPDVQMHEELIEQASAWCEGVRPSDLRLGYVFLRVGELHNDTERREGGLVDYDWLYVERTIVKDW